MFYSFLLTLYHVSLPISLPVAGGALLKRFKGVDNRALSALALYVLSPALIFETLVHAQVGSGDVGTTVLFCIINVIFMWGIAALMAKILKLNQEEQAGLTLVSVFTNSVNYGLPLIQLAFGQAGLDKASVFVVIQMILGNTVGVYFAARSHFTMKKALMKVLTMPAVYAAVLAAIVRMTGFSIPGALEDGVSLMAAAYAPVALSILGMQMAGRRSREGKTETKTGTETGTETKTANGRRPFTAAMVVRLIIAPAASCLLLLVLGVHGLLFSVLLVLCAMPAAVNALIMAEEFGADARTVSRCILWTTLLSFVTLPLLIGILQ
ncbi:AEC family transporter [Paenibacillus physcomitrellae]|uniref:Transporter n=1 Tax=Paenibacillus physcomitrellae TaxID=1619311 RepID=A0ABQ1FSC5_9BACL|nr:AEC family transporter [Paenibacillus physcomitrellae]GGA27300.1 transporter [Paenibacillus physcomitrellae]